jgi:hypothetical protein
MRKSASAPAAVASPEIPAQGPKPLPPLGETPWEPDAAFPFLFIRVNPQGQCVVSGPPDQVAQVKKQLLDFLSEGRSDQMPDDFERFEARAWLTWEAEMSGGANAYHQTTNRPDCHSNDRWKRQRPANGRRAGGFVRRLYSKFLVHSFNVAQRPVIYPNTTINHDPNGISPFSVSVFRHCAHTRSNFLADDVTISRRRGRAVSGPTVRCNGHRLSPCADPPKKNKKQCAIQLLDTGGTISPVACCKISER